MGQAFDREGNVLGEATGATKAEVLKTLESQFGDAAHEIRIKTIESRLAGPSSGASSPMPRYQCHKRVSALKILDVVDPTRDGNESDGSRLLHVEKPFSPIRVDRDYVRKHNPTQGGYYVVYDDGYASFSPATAFEEGYTRL